MNKGYFEAHTDNLVLLRREIYGIEGDINSLQKKLAEAKQRFITEAVSQGKFHYLKLDMDMIRKEESARIVEVPTSR